MSLLIKTIMKIIPGALAVGPVVSWLAWWPADPSNSFSAASRSLRHELCKLIRFGLNKFWPLKRLGWPMGLLLVDG